MRATCNGSGDRWGRLNGGGCNGGARLGDGGGSDGGDSDGDVAHMKFETNASLLSALNREGETPCVFRDIIATA